MRSVAAVAAVAVAVTLLSAFEARAFTCTTAGAGGPSLFWGDRNVVLERSGVGHELSADDIDRVITNAAAVWSAIDCSDVAESIGADTDDRLAGFDWASGVGGSKNHNIVVFRNDDATDPIDAWQHELGALAITTVTFESNEGRLLDADVEVNDAGFDFTACDPGPNCDVRFDLENTLVHEFGHVLGLDHSPIADATMFASAPEGDLSKRDLSDDDIAAICLIYPAGDLPGSCPDPDGNIVARKEPPAVVFKPALCGQGAHSAPLVATTVLLLLIRKRRNQAFARLGRGNSGTLDDVDVRSADLPRR